ncbi:MAG: M48 family metallopeptidase [Clostridia bacterium]|nr:M48 family metallopeptidase [Clostridia bacterium]
MNFKVLALALLCAIYAYQLCLRAIEWKSFSNPIPENVSDIYDAETYARWRRYSAEKHKWSLLRSLVGFAALFILILTNAYAAFAGLFGQNIYSCAFAVALLSVLTDTLLGCPFDYIDTMVVEQKYGFNNTTKKTFIADEIKQFIISLLITVGLTMLLASLHRWLGDYLVLAFAVVLFVIIMLISCLFPFLSKIFNKFTPLEEGELKQKLSALLEKNGYKVRAIQIMDASRRSNKSNAYFTGFGKTKTIVLYDTLVNTSTPDEICAVFAHEMGHGLHKDTLKNQIMSFIQTALIAVAAYLTVKYPQIYRSFGFEGVNYGFALILVMEIEMSVIAPLLNLFTAWRSRKAEYRADAQAASEGYGNALISALKKLAKQNYAHLAPSPIIVKLQYDHPTLSQRIEALDKLKDKN